MKEKTFAQHPLITVVTVTYNCEKLIEQTINSVCSQSYSNLEYIIVDGASKDATVEIVKRYGRCVTKFISEKDHGIYDAMNKGIQLASPESGFITFLNAGDVYLGRDVIQTMLASAKSKQAGLYGNISVNRRVLEAPGKLSQWSLSTNMVCHQACLFQTEVHRKFLYDTQYKICADYKLFLDLIQAGEFFEKIDITVAEMDTSGVSHVQRRALLDEKEKIRRLYPMVYFFAGIKNTFNKFRRMFR